MKINTVLKLVQLSKIFVLACTILYLSNQKKAFGEFTIPPTRVMEVALSIYKERAIVGNNDGFYGIKSGLLDPSKLLPRQTDEPEELKKLSSWLDINHGMVVIQSKGPFFLVTLYSREITEGMNQEVKNHREKIGNASHCTNWYWKYKQDQLTLTDCKTKKGRSFFPTLNTTNDYDHVSSPNLLQVKRGSLLTAIHDVVHLKTNPGAKPDHSYRIHEAYSEGTYIPHDVGRYHSFIRPNEYETFRFGEPLQNMDPSQSGALLSVGTIRTLLDASMGDFSKVVMFDIDSSVSCYNNEHLKLIELINRIGPSSTQGKRYFYLLAMQGCWNDRKMSEGFQKWMDYSDSSLDNFGSEVLALNSPYIPNTLTNLKPLNLCQGLMYRKFVRDRNQILPLEVVFQFMRMEACKSDNESFDNELNRSLGEWKRTELASPRSFKRIYKSWREEYVQGNWMRHFYNEFAMENGRNIFGNSERISKQGIPIRYYWESDQGWKRLIRLIKRKQIFAVTGSLVGNRSMPSLIQAFTHSHEKVKAIDISNVEDYLDQHELLKMKGYFNRLPSTQDATLLRTQVDPNKSGSDDRWLYHTDPLHSW